MDLFQIASREKFRYPSSKGALTTEQLWDLPLTSARSDSLDTVAKTINTELKNASEESFVETASNPQRKQLQTKLEVVKAVIAFKIDENERRRTAAHKANEKQFLLDLLERKKADQMGELSIDEIKARLAALD